MTNWKMKCVGCGEEIDLTCTNCDHEKLQLRKVESGSNNSLGLEYFECSHCKEQIQGFQHKCESYVDGYYGEVIFKQAGTDLKRNRDNFFELKYGGSGGFFVPLLILSFIVITFLMQIYVT